MAADLDAVDWAALTHAYGSASDVPQAIRQLYSGDRDDVRAAASALAQSIHHQGTVYPATVAAVPFLVDAALNARVNLADQIVSIAMLADPHHAYGIDLPATQAAVRTHAGRLGSLLHNEDPEIQAAVVYLAVTTGTVSLDDLAVLWDEAEDPVLRVALLFAMA